MNAADDVFSPGGLAVFLTSTAGEPLGSGVWNHPPRVPVFVEARIEPIYVTADDLRCRDCGTGFDVPSSKPVTWLAANRVLNDGLCGDCSD